MRISRRRRWIDVDRCRDHVRGQHLAAFGKHTLDVDTVSRDGADHDHDRLPQRGMSGAESRSLADELGRIQRVFDLGRAQRISA